MGFEYVATCLLLGKKKKMVGLIGLVMIMMKECLLN